SVVTLVWGISPRQPSGKNIIRWLLKKRTNGSVRYCQYTSVAQAQQSAGAAAGNAQQTAQDVAAAATARDDAQRFAENARQDAVA
ncbi:hypothetical protein ACVODM_24220, partial [Shigella flexneri]